MTDFHSHILPKLDDGSKSPEQTVEMLQQLLKQGIRRVVATPHFYANSELVEEFLKRRENSFERLRPFLKDDLPEIVLGAEVRYYEGISRLKELKDLCIQGTNLLLLEMPMGKWSEFALRELIDLSSNGSMTIVMAHIERYLVFQRKDIIYYLLNNGILLQMNAENFLNFSLKRKAFKYLKKQYIHFIGSDCHNIDSRPPNCGKAYKAIEKKLGKSFVEDLVNFGNECF